MLKSLLSKSRNSNDFKLIDINNDIIDIRNSISYNNANLIDKDDCVKR